MSKDPKERVKNILLKLHEKELKAIKRMQNQTPRKNKKPEKLVEEECLKWMREQEWEVQIIESKATYNPHAGRYTQNQSVKSGNADCQGIMPDGTSVAVEFKAKGCLNNFLRDKNIKQRDFIIKRIHMNGFAAVVDSADMLINIYKEWNALRGTSKDSARQFLLDSLPKREKQTLKQTTKNLFE